MRMKLISYYELINSIVKGKKCKKENELHVNFKKFDSVCFVLLSEMGMMS